MEEKFISGIHNYCDRWCERCTLTSRCSNFDASDTSDLKQDLNNKEFWYTLSEHFDKAFELLKKAAAEQGIQLDKNISAEEEANYKQHKLLINSIVKNHSISILCKQYQKIATNFIKNSEGLTNKTKELVSHLHLGIKSEEDVMHTVADISDCFEIIQWYLFFIDAKLQRAIRGKTETENWEVENGYQKDSDGSAKIALIAIEKNIAAWVKIYELLPTSEDIALQALSLLTQLRTQAVMEFPQAMQFIRPGFDE